MELAKVPVLVQPKNDKQLLSLCPEPGFKLHADFQIPYGMANLSTITFL